MRMRKRNAQEDWLKENLKNQLTEGKNFLAYKI